jgi:hypothetical protein
MRTVCERTLFWEITSFDDSIFNERLMHGIGLAVYVREIPTFWEIWARYFVFFIQREPEFCIPMLAVGNRCNFDLMPLRTKH